MGFYMEELSVNIPRVIDLFNKVSESMYMDASYKGLLPGINYRTFKDVAIKLFNSVHGTPNPQVIRAISAGKIF